MRFHDKFVWNVSVLTNISDSKYYFQKSGFIQREHYALLHPRSFIAKRSVLDILGMTICTYSFILSFIHIPLTVFVMLL